MLRRKSKWARAMREDWDDWARSDAFYYSTWKVGHRWTRDEFFASGERDYQMLVEPVLQSVGLEPDKSDMLELGCGVGRMTRSFARRFSHVSAVDISPEMLSRARGFNGDLPNLTWQLVNGFDLASFQDGQMDFTFSFLVFQHVPHRDIVLGNIGEMLRVLRLGGFFLFRYNSEHAPPSSLGARVIWGILDRWRIPLLPRLFRIDAREAGKTWDGAVLNIEELKVYIETHDGTLSGSKGAGTPAAWCWGTRLS